jgi:hypothetical protein
LRIDIGKALRRGVTRPELVELMMAFGWLALLFRVTTKQNSGAAHREVAKLHQQASQSILVDEQVLTSTSRIAISNPPGITSGFLALDWKSG